MHKFSNMKKIKIIGSCPPPYGGISVHIQRLASVVSNEFLVEIVDITKEFCVSELNVFCCGNRTPINLIRAIMKLSVDSFDIAHFHVSAMDKFVLAGFPLLFSLNAKTKKIVTIHSGSFCESYRRSFFLKKKITRTLLRKFDHIITVNCEQSSLLQSLSFPPSKISIIPAFLPPVISDSPDIYRRVNKIREYSKRLILVSGYALKYYGFSTVLDAIEIIDSFDKRFGVIFAFYNEYDASYKAELESRLKSRFTYDIFTDLVPEEFSQLLSLVDIYIRATDRDGDAVALREAAFFNKQVIASDCVTRPEGTILFKTMDPYSLKAALEDVEVNPEKGIVRFNFDSNTNNILNIYKTLAGINK